MGGCTALKARRRASLLAKDPRCWYCGREVRFKPPGMGSKVDPDIAVIEAELSRNETGTQPKGARKYLSCYQCADERSKYEFFIFKMWRDRDWAKWREENGKPTARTNKERRAETELRQAAEVLLGPDGGILYDGC